MHIKQTWELILVWVHWSHPIKLSQKILVWYMAYTWLVRVKCQLLYSAWMAAERTALSDQYLQLIVITVKHLWRERRCTLNNWGHTLAHITAAGLCLVHHHLRYLAQQRLQLKTGSYSCSNIPESSLGTWILGHQTGRYRSTDCQWADQTSLQTLDSCARNEGHFCPPPQECMRNCPSAKVWSRYGHDHTCT